MIGEKNGQSKIKKIEPMEYVIGRMQHICQKENGEDKLWNKKVKKNRKN